MFLHSCRRRLGCTDIRVRVKNASGGCVNAVNNASTCHCNWCVHAGLVFCHFKNIYVCIKGIKAPVLVRHVLKIYAAQWPHCWPFTRVNQLNRESCAVVTSFKITQVYNCYSCTGLFLTRRIQSSWRKKMLWKSKIQNLLRCNHLNSNSNLALCPSETRFSLQPMNCCACHTQQAHICFNRVFYQSYKLHLCNHNNRNLFLPIRLTHTLTVNDLALLKKRFWPMVFIFICQGNDFINYDKRCLRL